MSISLPIPKFSSLSGDAGPTALASGSYRFKTPAGELHLLPDGAVFDPVSSSLLVADVHVGKAEVFRRLGVPVPALTSNQTLDRLSASIKVCEPKQVIVLGDLIHGRLPSSHAVFDLLARWREGHADINISLLRGNHDHHAGDPPSRCRIDIWPVGRSLGPWQLCHEPQEARSGAGMALCGHVHPVFQLRSAYDSLRVRCFWAQEQLLVLPAFGVFTGGFAISPNGKDKVFLLDGQQVRPVPLGRQKWRGKRTRAARG